MRSKRAMTVWIGVAVVGLLLMGALLARLLDAGISSAETMSEQEVRDAVLSRYPGEVVNLEPDRDRFRIELERDSGRYHLVVDARSGEVLSLELGEAFDPPVGPGTPADEEPGEEPHSPPEQEPETPPAVDTEPPLLLSEEEAEAIALEQFPGEVDDVDWKQVDGVGFYLVEIELDDDREVIVQVHGITGEVMSISWDD